MALDNVRFGLSRVRGVADGLPATLGRRRRLGPASRRSRVVLEVGETHESPRDGGKSVRRNTLAVANAADTVISYGIGLK